MIVFNLTKILETFFFSILEKLYKNIVQSSICIYVTDDEYNVVAQSVVKISLPSWDATEDRG